VNGTTTTTTEKGTQQMKNTTNIRQMKITITDEEGIVLASFDRLAMQQEWDDDPQFGDEGITVGMPEMAEAVKDELAGFFYAKYDDNKNSDKITL